MKISKKELQEIILEELRKEMLEEGELEEGIGRKLRSLFGMQSEKDFDYDLADLDREEHAAAEEAKAARRQADLDRGVEVEESLNAAMDTLMDAKSALLRLSQLDAEAVGDPHIKSKLRAFSTTVKGMYDVLRKIARGRNPGMKPTEAGMQGALDRARRTRGKTFAGNPGEANAGMVRGNVAENKKRKKR